MSEEFKDFSARFANQQRDAAASAIGDAHAILVAGNPRPRIVEESFKYWFLPYFSGDQNAPQLQGRNVVADWIGVAGTAMSEVDVVDAQGNVLFAVPALFDTNMLEIASRTPGRSFADLYYEYELRKGGVPAVANNYLSQALFNKGQDLTRDRENTITQTAAQRWTAIMQRYNIPAVTDGIKQPPAGPALVDDVIYD